MTPLTKNENLGERASLVGKMESVVLAIHATEMLITYLEIRDWNSGNSEWPH